MSTTLPLIFLISIVTLVTAINSSVVQTTARSPVQWTNNFSPNATILYGDGLQARAILSLALAGQSDSSASVCGFFCNLDCRSFIFAVGILTNMQNVSYNNTVISISSNTPELVWSANGDRPVSDNAAVHFTRGGDLILRDADNTKIWPSETENRSVVGMKLTEAGLVLFNNNNFTVWESRDGIPKDQTSRGQFVRSTLGPILVALSATFFVIGFFILVIRINLHPDDDEDGDRFDSVPGLPARFSFEELTAATGNFCRKLGHGGFGSVFEGTINGQRVAVKRLDGVGQGVKEFLAEVTTIGNTHHISLVNLIGFCSEKHNRLLVYEYMCNGSLDKWIFRRNQTVSLDWPTRRSIITDVAKGLSYLHEECRQRIAHLDIKPQNILLDEKFRAKISDFGLSTLIDRDQSHVSTTTRGTRGYMAPELLRSRITEKVDVYSFGVVVMEIVWGRRNLDHSQPEECVHLVYMLETMIRDNRLLELVDDRGIDVKLHGSEILEVMKLAMWCLQSVGSRRPSMSVVVKVLEGSASVETDIDYNFTDPTPNLTSSSDSSGASSQPPASVLSGGR